MKKGQTTLVVKIPFELAERLRDLVGDGLCDDTESIVVEALRRFLSSHLRTREWSAHAFPRNP